MFFLNKVWQLSIICIFCQNARTQNNTNSKNLTNSQNNSSPDLPNSQNNSLDLQDLFSVNTTNADNISTNANEQSITNNNKTNLENIPQPDTNNKTNTNLVVENITTTTPSQSITSSKENSTFQNNTAAKPQPDTKNDTNTNAVIENIITTPITPSQTTTTIPNTGTIVPTLSPAVVKFLNFLSIAFSNIYEKLNSNIPSPVPPQSLATNNDVTSLFKKTNQNTLFSQQSRDDINSLSTAVNFLKYLPNRWCQELILCLIKFSLEKIQLNPKNGEATVRMDFGGVLNSVEKFSRDIDPDGRFERKMDSNYCSAILQKCPESTKLQEFKMYQ